MMARASTLSSTTRTWRLVNALRASIPSASRATTRAPPSARDRTHMSKLGQSRAALGMGKVLPVDGARFAEAVIRSPPVGLPCVGGIEAGGSKIVCGIGTGPDDLRAETCILPTTPTETLARLVEFFRDPPTRTPSAALGIASVGPPDLDRDTTTAGFCTRP